MDRANVSFQRNRNELYRNMNGKHLNTNRQRSYNSFDHDNIRYDRYNNRNNKNYDRNRFPEHLEGVENSIHVGNVYRKNSENITSFRNNNQYNDDRFNKQINSDFQKGYRSQNTCDLNRRVILHRMTSSEEDDNLDSSMFRNEYSMPFKSKSNVFNRLSSTKKSFNFPENREYRRRTRFNSHDEEYYLKREREFFSDFKGQQFYDDYGSVNARSSNNLNESGFHDSDEANQRGDEKTYEKSFKDSRKMYDVHRIRRNYDSFNSYKSQGQDNRTEMHNHKDTVFDRDLVIRDVKETKLSESRTKSSFYDQEEQDTLRRYINDKLLRTPPFDNEKSGKETLQVFMDKMGVTSDELKKYLDQELKRRNDIDILQTSLRNLYRDKLLASFEEESSKTEIFDDQNLIRTDYSMHQRATSPLHLNHQVSPVGTQYPTGNDTKNPRNKSGSSCTSRGRTRKRSHSPYYSSRKHSEVCYDKCDYRSNERSEFFESHEDLKKQGEKRSSRHDRFRSNIDCTKQTRSVHKQKVKSPKRNRRRPSVDNNVDEIKKIRRSKKAHSESPIKFDDSIERMLIEAADESVEQFKEEQANEGISRKPQEASSLNFIPVLPTVTQATFTLPCTTNLFTGNVPIVELKSNVVIPPCNMNEVNELQSNLLVGSPSASSISHSKSLEIPSEDSKEANVNKNSPPHNMHGAGVPEKSPAIKEVSSSDYPNIEETLSMLKKESSQTNAIRSEIIDNNAEKCDEHDMASRSSDDEITITKVIDSNKDVIGVSTPYQRTVTVKSSNKTGSNSTAEHTSSILKTKVRVPSWFNSRCIELLKKRHKKMQQLKKAKKDPNSTNERLGSLKESLRDINREYIPLVKKSKSEYMEILEKNNNKPKSDEAATGSENFVDPE